ncbi:FecR family protein [Tunicatimonas pelagia]|uniref:FecR family protein n=1 Tax=Tunicatimonas pelagia TaxID=931531 RepID=UPI002664F3F4|nr:FecR domain-containing protein [Tunicatimonas pelagia]WKN42622.1 FecR domain-containing protein [Tunicatimonas pelagia]
MDRDLDKIIRDYLSGEDTPEGKALFEAWYAAQSEGASPLEGLGDAEKERIRQEILTKAKQPLSILKEEKPDNLPKNHQKPIWYRMAAVWGGLLLISIACLLYFRYGSNTVTIQTAYGEISEVGLPDGSTVTLNANSTLRYATDWEEQADREVWLEGEAFFSVAHTLQNQRFRVHASDMNVEVLGTEFNVNTRRGDTEVVLHSGQVKLVIDTNQADSATVMRPGELAAYTESEQRLVKKVVNPQRYSHWRQQELVLDNTSLGEVAQAMEDYYGFTIIIPNDSLKNNRLTATTKLSLKDAELILATISEIYGIEVQRNGNEITLDYP